MQQNPSMSPSEDSGFSMLFSMVRREDAREDAAADRVLAANENDPERPAETLGNLNLLAPPTPTDFVSGIVPEDNLRQRDLREQMIAERYVRGSGVFFALKIQSARTKKHLENLCKEVDNLKSLNGKAGCVQLRDHAISEDSMHVIILMELGACDLAEFLKKGQPAGGSAPSWRSLDVGSMVAIWKALVSRVAELHEECDMIHRDIKPHNFILVPMRGYSDAKLLARTCVPKENWVYRLVDKPSERPR